MPPGYWETCFSGDLAQLIRQGVLVVYPVSQLFPVARVNLRLRALAETLTVSPLPVDLFVPSLVKACRLAAEAVARLREEAASLSGASGQHPGHLVVTELAPLLAGVLKVSRAKRKACRDALEAAIQEALKDRPPTQLILSVDAGLSKV